MTQKHLTYGGSSMHRTLACPAWIRESQTAPPQPESPYAAEGSLLHNALETIVADDITPEQYRADNPHITDDQMAKIKAAHTAVGELFRTYKIDLDRVYVETFVELIPGQAGGSVDLFGISQSGETALFVDYKFGYNSVSPVKNPQLMFYALCASVDPVVATEFKDVKYIVLAIIQPNDDYPPITTWEAPIDVLDDYEIEVYSAIDATQNPAAPHNTGPHCKYCPAHAICPEKTGQALASKQLDPAQAADLSKALKMIPQLEEWISAVKAMAHDQLEKGVAIDGFKLVQKRATRQWADPDEVAKFVKSSRKIKIEDAYNTTLKSPAQMEKVFAEKGLDLSKLINYIATVSSGTTVVPDSDKRPAALPSQALTELAKRLT